MSDSISRQDAIDINKYYHGQMPNEVNYEIYKKLMQLPSAEPERKTGQLSNKEWIDFLVAQFDISRTSARDMLHVMMQVKREDNFKKQFSQRNGCLVNDLVKEYGGS